MKVHAGAYAGSGYVHTITGTSADMHDISETLKLLREDDHIMYGNFGYLGAPECPEIKENHFQSQGSLCMNIRKYGIVTTRKSITRIFTECS